MGGHVEAPAHRGPAAHRGTTLQTAVHRAARGDVDALADLYDHLVPSVHRLATLVLGRSPRVDDVVRATFVELWRRVPDPAFAPGGSVECWTLVTAHRLARSAADGPG